MRARFEFQPGVSPLADDPGNDFLVAAMLAGAFAKWFQRPATQFGISEIHAQQVAGEQGRLVASRPSTDFQKHVAGIVWVAR